jgi:Zn-dependent peptidase ImmA (M78 family)
MVAMARLTLDRMAIEDAGSNPEKLADAIHTQLGLLVKAVRVTEIAAALDITEIRYEPLESFEGALITTAERDTGSILVNATSDASRRRFTIAHELGHYLNVWHTPTSDKGFMCAKKDMSPGAIRIKPGLSVQEVQELQANQFAIELLAPRKSVERQTSDHPSLTEALSIAATLELSKAAATRRYAELHHMPIAIVYSHHGKVLYPIRSKSCPRLDLRTGDLLIPPQLAGAKRILEHDLDVAVRHGTDPAQDQTVAAQTLFQQNGYAVTLLSFEPDHDED